MRVVPQEGYLKTYEVAARLRVSADTVLRMVRRGEIPAHRLRVSGQYRYVWAEVEAALERAAAPPA